MTGKAASMRDVRDDQHAMHITWRRSPMANVVRKHSISSELAQKMVDEAVAKARDIGVRENVAILDDGAISRHSVGWMVRRSFPSRLRRIRRIPLCSASPRRTFSTLSKATRRSWPASPRLRVWRRTEEGFLLRWTEKLSGRSG